MTKNTPRIFISLLLMLLCIGILPVSAFASSGDYPADTLPAAESSAADAQKAKQIGTVTTLSLIHIWPQRRTKTDRSRHRKSEPNG